VLGKVRHSRRGRVRSWRNSGTPLLARREANPAPALLAHARCRSTFLGCLKRIGSHSALVAMTELNCSALLFDLDGVLVDSTAHVERHWSAWARRRGIDPELVLGLVHGRRAVDTVKSVAPWLDAEVEVAALVEAEVDDTAGVSAMPGAAALLARIPLARWAIVTSAGRRLAGARLIAAGLPLPPVLVAAEDVARGKPDPQGYLAAAARLGMSSTECAVVEDSPAGAAAARAAGMRLVAVTTTHDQEALQPADLVITGLERLCVEGVSDAYFGSRLLISETH